MTQVILLEEEERNKLDKLKRQYLELQIEYTKFIDNVTAKHGKFKLGESIYDLDSCTLLGVVMEISKQPRQFNPAFNYDIHYIYRPLDGPDRIMTTSQTPNLRFGTRAELVAELERRLTTLQN